MDESPTENLPLRLGDYRRLGAPLLVETAGLRADGFLARQYPFLSRSAWQARIRSGMLLVCGQKVRPSYVLKEGDFFNFFHPNAAEPEVDADIYPVWKEGGVLAVYKPANLPMHQNGPYRLNTFAHLLHTRIGPEWSAVHRLDLETSGIVLCAANHLVRRGLGIALEERTVTKEYLAIARGVPPEPVWVDYGPIGNLIDSRIRIKKWVVPDGLPAETRFTVLGSRSGVSLLRAEPKTGRTNQIRIHAAFAGHPLVGDKLYHPDEGVFLEYHEKGTTDWVAGMTGHDRLCLHAASIAFTHPETGRPCEVRCPMPDDMQNLWDSLG